MAHLSMLRESLAFWQRVRDQLPLPCLLCRSRAPGGLCRHCRGRVCRGMARQAVRCPRCDLPLGDGLPACPDCPSLPAALRGVVAAFDYLGPGELLIQAFKQRGEFSCAPVLAGLLARRCRRLQTRAGAYAAAGVPRWCSRGTWVTAVPAGREALLRRGYNPAAELGRALARRLGLPWRPDLLQRGEGGLEQKRLGRHARRSQARDLYRCSAAVSGRQILVVDDVMTTGSTLAAVAQVLRAEGAAGVWGAVAARTPARVPAAGRLDTQGRQQR